VPAFLEHASGHQLIDQVVFDQKNASGTARFPERVARDQRMVVGSRLESER
jgi:hypothetical protein